MLNHASIIACLRFRNNLFWADCCAKKHCKDHALQGPCFPPDVRHFLLTGADPKSSSKLQDLVTETEENVSLMSYLRSVYPEDWEHFKERLADRLGRKDLAELTEK